MASMILEYQTKTDSHRIAESVKWFEDIEDRYEINKTKYIYLEVILRQLFIHEKMNTAFFYENEKQIHLTKNITDLRGEIDYYLKKLDPSKNYGCHSLDFEKKERIKSASDAIRKQHADIDKIKEFSRQLSKEGSAISINDILAHFDELKIQVNKKVERSILTTETHSLKKFIKITENGEIIVNHKAFDFIRIYSLLMYALMNPYFSNLSDGETRGTGIYGYIAQKLSFEFGSRLGFKPSAKDIADKVRDNQQPLNHYIKKLADLGLAEVSKKI